MDALRAFIAVWLDPIGVVLGLLALVPIVWTWWDVVFGRRRPNTTSHHVQTMGTNASKPSTTPMGSSQTAMKARSASMPQPATRCTRYSSSRAPQAAMSAASSSRPRQSGGRSSVRCT